MAFGSTTVTRSDLQFTATTGPAKAGIEELRRTFRSATSGMSDDALRLQSAQLRADDAIARSHGKVTRSTLAAELNLRKLALENDHAASTARRAGSAWSSEARDLERFGRGALVGTGALRGLGRAAAFASTTFIGGAGLVYGIRSALHQAEQQTAILANLRNAVEDAGFSWTAYRGKIESATEATKRHSAFDDDELYKSLQLLVRGTGNLNRALTLNALAADVARGRNMGLVQSAQLLIRIQAGQIGSARRLGIAIDKGASAERAIAQVRERYAGAADRYTRSAIGAQTDLTVAIDDTEKAIGRGLLPTAKRYELTLANYLNDAGHQKKIQHEVNAVISDAAKVIHGLVDAERLIAPPIHTAINAMGGLEHAVEVAFIIGLALKAKRGATAVGLIPAASAKARTAIVADAAVEEKALAGVAAEAKVVADTLAGVGAAGAAGAAGKGLGAAGLGGLLARGAGKGLRVAGRVGEFAVLLEAINILTGQHTTQESGPSRYSGSKGWGNLLHDLPHPLRLIGNALDNPGGLGKPGANPNAPATLRWADVWPGIQAGVLTVGAIRKLKNRFATEADYNGALTYAQQVARENPKLNLPAQVSGNAPLLGYLSPAQKRDAALAEHPNSLTALTTQRDYDVNAIAFLKRRFAAGKIAGKDYLTQLKSLESDRDQQQSSIDQIHADAARKRDAAARKRDAAAKHAAAAERTREAKARREYRSGLSSDALQLRDAATQELRAETKGIRVKTVGGKVVADAHFVEPAAQRQLIAFYKRETDDVKLTGAEQTRYHHLYISELGKVDQERDAFDRKVTTVLKAARKRQADHLKTQREIRQAILQNRLSEAQLAETEAGKNAGAVRKARKRELDAELAILDEQRREGKGLTGLAKQQNIADQLATRSAIAQLKQQLAPAKADAGANERQFLSSFANIVRNFAPNAFPAKAGTHLYELVHETRRTNKHLTELNAGARFPNSRAAEVAVQAAFG